VPLNEFAPLSAVILKLPDVVRLPLFAPVVFAIDPPVDPTPSAYAARDASL
jgi:hypothetical protein